MDGSRFQVGDRVRALMYTSHIRAGMVGTVKAVFLPQHLIYMVQFDELPKPEIAIEELLELVQDPPPSR